MLKSTWLRAIVFVKVQVGQRPLAQVGPGLDSIKASRLGAPHSVLCTVIIVVHCYIYIVWTFCEVQLALHGFKLASFSVVFRELLMVLGRYHAFLHKS